VIPPPSYRDPMRQRRLDPSGVLTPRRRAILSYLATHPAPTVRDIMQAVGLRSSSTVYNHLLALYRAGLVDGEPLRSRTTRLHSDVVVSESGRLIGWWARLPASFDAEVLS
jgi:DNA-binding transcriptional ArsR family regulator